MKSIKFIQWGSAIAVLTVAAYILVAGAVILFSKTGATMDDLMKQAIILGFFVGPEVVAAFFGNLLKRWQNGKKQDPANYVG